MQGKLTELIKIRRYVDMVLKITQTGFILHGVMHIAMKLG